MLPWVMLMLHMLQGGDPATDLIGIAVGHLYFYLKIVLPQTHGYHIVKTPNWVKEMVKAIEQYNQGGPQPPNNWFARQLQRI